MRKHSAHYHVKEAQAQAIARFLFKRRKGTVWIDGPIAETGCIRVRWTLHVEGGGGIGPEVHEKGVFYLDAKGREVRWNTQEDRPRETVAGRVLVKGGV